jgi:redox-sensitive bicupin YhaK (pirin superfamily)
MLTLRKAKERGHANHGWLDTYHSFSFAHYYDPQHMGFQTLRVINEDKIQPGMGFGTHSHRDMEIITYVISGALAHKDSIGTSSVIHAGEVQIMSAGTGISHSEFNATQTDWVHLLQIWIIPDKRGIMPRYDQKLFTTEDKQGKLKLIVSPDGREDSILIHQDVDLYATILKAGEKVEHFLKPQRHAWIQIVKGSALINSSPVTAGDGMTISEDKQIVIKSQDDTELLLFDLA